ncbi:uncharacterized protein DEA37_0011596, partial [Paragonimus westermani]
IFEHYRRLSKAERECSESKLEAVVLYCTVKRLHKYLFGLSFTIAIDHVTLKFLYPPIKSPEKSSSAMVQSRSISGRSHISMMIHRKNSL